MEMIKLRRLGSLEVVEYSWFTFNPLSLSVDHFNEHVLIELWDTWCTQFDRVLYFVSTRLLGLVSVSWRGVQIYITTQRKTQLL